ncbi:MAG: hypothetical protein QOJ64_661 [Acidobacteriota bacterium]|nr:hypothetical protein [Acidobacteriota bacterium]
MKQCPACNRTYADDGLSYCLEDGASLLIVEGSSNQPASFDSNSDPYKTLAFTPGRETSPPPLAVHPVASPHPPVPAQPAWSPGHSPGYAAAPARKSGKGWIVGAIIGVALLGIGIIVLLAIIGKNSSATTANTNRAVVESNSNRAIVTNVNNANRAEQQKPTGVLKEDFSAQNWPTGEASYGSFYQDGEYHMVGRPKLYVYMFPRDIDRYKSDNAIVKVTARSVDGKSPEYGYGLVIHGKVNQTRQLEGYGFLIYTGAEPKYKIARFAAGEPKAIVEWKASSAIRRGTSPNQIEVRTSGSSLSLYINGQLVESITDTAGITSGYVGLYTSETNEVAFDDMEIEPN